MLLGVILVFNFSGLAQAQQKHSMQAQQKYSKMTIDTSPLLPDAGDRQNDVYRGPYTGWGMGRASACCSTVALTHRIEPPLIQHFTRMSLDADTHFDFDKATLKPAGIVALNGLTNKIAAMDPGYGMGRYGYVLGIDVVGHTDWIGTIRYNDGLGARRADTVRRYLMSQGIQGNYINTQSMGELLPVADNRSDQGRALNRRVEIVVQTARLP
jgi:outer membrane protein OmpA-like peptidoglycan-associated protein